MKDKKELEKEARWLSEMTRRIMDLGNVEIHLSTGAVAELVRDLRERRIK